MPKRKKQRGLTEAERRAACEGYARFETTAEVLAALERPGLKTRTVERYNADLAANRSTLAARWIRLFDATRRAFLDNVDGIDVVHRAFRLREYSRMYHEARRAQDNEAAVRILQAAAKECPPDTGIARLILQLENTDE